MQPRGPRQAREHMLRIGMLCSKLFEQVCTEFFHAHCLRVIGMVAAHELLYRRVAHITMLNAAEHVPQHAVAQAAFGGVHRLDAQLAKHRRHNGETAGENWLAILAQARQIQLAQVAGADQLILNPGHTHWCDAAGTRVSGLQHFGNRTRRAARADGLFPFVRREIVDNGFEFRRRGDLGFFKGFCRQFAIAKITLTEADTAHV